MTRQSVHVDNAHTVEKTDINFKHEETGTGQLKMGSYEQTSNSKGKGFSSNGNSGLIIRRLK